MPVIRFTTIFILSLFLSQFLPAQKLFLPRNLQRSYDNQTRSNNGKPGAKYWQNRAEYRIDVQVDVPNKIVSGKSNIRYFNNSPDTLKLIRLKLAHDLWRKNSQRAYELAAADITEGVEIRELRLNDAPLFGDQIRQANTFLDLTPDQPLPPGQSVDLSLEWSYIAPSAPGTVPRECVCDSTTWFVAYWYPQVAVYDDLHGWADAPYNGLQEMYNDFSDYEVRISVPGNTMVWATGVWENSAELLNPEFEQRYQKALSTTDIVKIFSPEDYAAKKPFFQTAERHTFLYKAQGVPDFAFGFSDHYLWDATTVTVDPATGRKALAAAAYNPDSKDYYDVCRITGEALKLFSTWLPGYPYPYPRMTVFNGDDGMEFPMMCNDASTHPQSPIGLTVHESSHTYFPFMMGINEQYYAWMDEGWAAFFDVLVTDSIAGKSQGRLRNYPDAAGTDMDMPPMVPSRNLGHAYRVAAYNRPQAAYFALVSNAWVRAFSQVYGGIHEPLERQTPATFRFFQYLE
jgi:hypothetical protein